MATKARPVRNAFETFIPDGEPGVELAGARRLPLALIVPNAQQARRTFDETALGELAESIRRQGVLEPILVRPLGDKYQIIAGERRYRAASLAGQRDIPALIREMDDVEAALATAVENLQREDLDIEDEAQQFATLLALTGLSQRKLGEQLGVNHVYISRRVKLLQRPDLLAAYRRGQMTLFEVLRKLDEESVSARNSGGASGEGEEPGRVSPAPQAFRWRWIDDAHNRLRRVKQARLTPEEFAALAPRLDEIQAEIEGIRAAHGAGSPARAVEDTPPTNAPSRRRAASK